MRNATTNAKSPLNLIETCNNEIMERTRRENQLEKVTTSVSYTDASVSHNISHNSLAASVRGWRHLDLVEGRYVHALDEVFESGDLIFKVVRADLVIFDDARDLKLLDPVSERHQFSCK